MRKKYVALGVIAIACVASAILYFRGCSRIKVETKVNVIDADNNKSTEVYATLNAPMESRNMVWCGTMQLAWNELRDNIIKEDIKLKGESVLSTDLNKKTFTKDNLSDKDYIAMVGYAKDGIVDKVNKELKNKFKEEGPWKVETKLQRPDDILAYSFLKKQVEFKNAFENIKDGINFEGKTVKAFGIDKFGGNKRDGLLGQVRVLSYNNEDDFIIELKGENSNEELVLAKIPPKKTLEETLDYALKDRKEFMGSINKLKVPKISFVVDKKFKELEGKYLLNENFKEYEITSVIQKTLFTLTENGAVLKSKAEIGMSKSAAPISRVNLIFDKPFLIYMKEKDKDKPYFALWLNNAELMIEK